MSSPGLNVAITTGVAALLGGYTAWTIKNEYNKLQENNKKDLAEVVDLVKLEDIGNLLDSDHLEVKQAAENFLLQRAASDRYLPAILSCCLSDDREVVVKAVTAVFLLCKASHQNKQFLLKENGIKILAKVVENISVGYQYKSLVTNCKHDVVVEKILLRTIGSIFQLTLNDVSAATQLSRQKAFIRDIILHILSDHGFHILIDVKHWSTYIVHQLVQNDVNSLKKSLRKWGVLTKTTLCLIRTLGDTLMTQLCLQILIQYLNDSVDEIVKVCQEMASLGLLPHLVGLLRSEEEENIQLSAIIIHHFCCFDIDIRNMCKIPGIVKILFAVLNSNEAAIQKTILRIYNYLSVSSVSFQMKLLKNQPLIKRLSVCLSSGNREVVQGSLMLIHDMAMAGKHAAQKIVNGSPEILKSLVSLAISSSGEAAQLIAETLGFFCSCEALHSTILNQGVINAILHFAKSTDTSVQFWASTLLLNLSMISEEIKETIIRNGGMVILLEMAVSGDESDMPDIAANATKAMVILSFLDKSIDVKLTAGLDGSIIIDGTEYCPGKLGVNIVSLDFIRYKYSKGKVLAPHEFQDYMSENYVNQLKKWDPVFIVTQGDCTIVSESSQDAETSNFFKNFIQNEKVDDELLTSPVWMLTLSPRDSHVTCGSDNLLLQFDLPFEHCVSSVLKDNFTEPLIDVLLSSSPASAINKTADLALIEVLARHPFQRKAIFTTAGFLEYLYEMIWPVISLKVENFHHTENATKLPHCIAALKIIHLCSIDESSLPFLINRGLLNVLFSLLHSLTCHIQTNASHNVFTFSRQSSMKGVDKERPKQAACSELTDKQDEEKEEEQMEDDLFSSSGYFRGNLHIDTVTASNDSIFYETDEHEGATRTVHFDVEDSNQASDASRRTSGRTRADSYIVRADTRNINRNQSPFLDNSTSTFENREDTILSPLPTRGSSRGDTSNHQQLRRISRSMSVSLQLSKTNKKDDESVVPNFDETLQKVASHAIMISYHVLNHSDEQTWATILSSHYIPVLFIVLSLFDDKFKMEIGLPVSCALGKCQNFLMEITQDVMQSTDHVCLQHVGRPYSLILSVDKLQVLNKNWFFESVRANQSVSARDSKNQVAGWYFEVTIHTSGIMQVGWANEDCLFNPEKGIGVGDTIDSCGFDGTRKKIWSGPSRDVVLDNDYGINWQSGDTLSVLLSWDGLLSFWLNGKDLGRALPNLDMTKDWYPAASLSIDQSCSFVFHERNLKYKSLTDFVTISTINEEAVHINIEFATSDVLSINDLKHNGNSQLAVYFFEADISSFDDVISVVTIGYIYHYGSTKTADSSHSPMNVYKKLFKNVDLSAWHYDKRAKVIGCGIVLQNKSMILTRDDEIVYEIPLYQLFGSVEFKEEMIIQMVPYFSVSNIPINYGERLFTYEMANSIHSKQKFINIVRSVLDRDES